MKKSSETSLQVINNSGILKKIVNFIKALFYKEENVPISVKDKNGFFKSIKFDEDPDKAILLKIQDEIETRGITKENVIYITKNLTQEQKQKLLKLYEEQIKKYEKSIENHKKNIVAIRKKLA